MSVILGRQRCPYIIFRNRFLYGFMFVYVYIYIYIYIRRDEFWVKVMRIEGNRLVRMVMLEAMGLRGKVKWIEKLKQSLEEIGWMGVEMEELGKLSNGEVVQMLRDCVWRAVKESWAVQAEQHSKLKVVKELKKIRCEATCIDVESKAIQRMLTKLRGELLN